MYLLTQHLQPTANAKNPNTALCSPADLGSQPGLAQITQTLDGVLAARQDHSMICVQPCKLADRHNSNAVLVNERIELVEIAGVGIGDQGNIDVPCVGCGTVM